MHQLQYIVLSLGQKVTVNQFLSTNGIDTELGTSNHLFEIVFPMVFIFSLMGLFISLVKYLLEYRLRNKLINRGMADQLTEILAQKNDQNKRNDIVKWAILFCGVGLGLIVVYLSTPINIHSLAIIAFSLGLSYLSYFFYLKRNKD